jgi:hypothetical protein
MNSSALFCLFVWNAFCLGFDALWSSGMAVLSVVYPDSGHPSSRPSFLDELPDFLSVFGL